MNLSISRRLSEIETVLRRNEPEKLYVRLKDGTVEVADAVSIWNYFNDEELRGQVANITTDSPGYIELCGLIMALCGVIP